MFCNLSPTTAALVTAPPTVEVVVASTTPAGTSPAANFLSGGEVFAVALAVIVLLGLVAVIVVVALRRRKQHQAEAVAPVALGDIGGGDDVGDTPEDFL
jgi:hypothetical protein